MINDIIILGSGASINQGINLGLSNYVENFASFGINEAIKFFDCTAYTFGDWYAYADRFELYSKANLVIGRYDMHIGRKIEGARYCPKHEGLILLQGSGKYYGRNGLEKGLYSSVLTGAFTLNLSLCLNPKRIFLCGFDNCEINGLTHFYSGISGAGQFKDFEGKATSGVGKNEKGEYKTSFYNNTDASINALWKPFAQEKDISIFNVSLESRISIFQKINYPEMFQRLDINKNRINQVEAQNQIRQQLEPFNKAK